MQVLEETFISLCKNYSEDLKLITRLWTEIEKNHSEKGRHYHSLGHLQNLLKHLTLVKEKINNWNVVLFTLYYHDSIYNSLKSDNEEKSAELAEQRMNELSAPEKEIKLCVAQILATKSHKRSDDTDTDYFTDADLSILGESWETYTAYLKNVRKEYAIYPDLFYKPGRKKVLAHFLEMDRIYKTDYFFDKLEKQARENLKRELEGL